jgi:ribosome-binding factor A
LPQQERYIPKAGFGKTTTYFSQIMESTRQAKISRLIQKELSEIFRRQTSKLRGVLVSVSAVRVSPDLSIARAYLSVFPSDKAAEVIQSINASSKTIRYELAQIVRHQLRKTPELAFYLDDSLDYIENIDNLLEADARKHPAHPEKELPEAPEEKELPEA